MNTKTMVLWALDNGLALSLGTYLGWRFTKQVGTVVNTVEGAVKGLYKRIKGA